MKGKTEMSMLHSERTKASGGIVARGVLGVPVEFTLCSSIGLMSLCALIVALFVFPAFASASEACQNEARRAEQGSTYLPDCRAYEMVTPPDKDSGETRAVIPGFHEYSLEGISGAHASLSGERMAWNSEYNLPGSSSIGLDYLSTRGARGWSSEDVIPPQSVENGTGCPFIVTMTAYSSDLSKGVLADGWGQPGGLPDEQLSCGHDEPRLVPGEPEAFQNLFVRDNDERSYNLVNVTPATAPPPKETPGSHTKNEYYPASFLAGSSSLDHVVFEEELPLTPEAPFIGDNLYEWSDGAVRLVTILPNGAPVLGSTTGILAGSTRNHSLESEIEGEHGFRPVSFNIANYRHAVSGNGSRVLFNAEGNLYVREHAEREQSALGVKDQCLEPEKACTLQVDASQGSGPGGGGKFMIASEDGSKVFFTDSDSAGLTGDTVTGSGQNLYEFDVVTGVLTDLTATSDARVDGVSGASEDSTYLYFVAEGDLTGQEKNSEEAQAKAGQPNLYLLHEGVTRFIATLEAGTMFDPRSDNDSCDWMSQECIDLPEIGGQEGGLTSRVSPDGSFIGFDSVKSLTGYDNEGSSCVAELVAGNASVSGFGPGACREVFLYDAAANRLSCASCDPSGVAPTGPAMIRYPAASRANEVRNTYPQHNVSNSGQVFFETADALVPSATNGKRDVYEYEDGQPHLISSGTNEADSYFLDASTDGRNVFFATAQPLLSRDSDAAYDIYDARVNGGFIEPTARDLSCEGEGCRGTAAVAPTFSALSSMTINSVGNVSAPIQAKPVEKPKSKPVKCKKGYVKKKDKCARPRRKRRLVTGNPTKGRK